MIKVPLLLTYIFLLGLFCSTPIDFALTVPALLAVLLLLDRCETHLDVIVITKDEVKGEMLDALIASSMDDQDYAMVRVLHVDIDRLEEAVRDHLTTDDEEQS